MLLVRKYIHKRLQEYYHQRGVVGGVSNPISFSWLLGEWHWKRKLRNLYKHSQWLTPVELFQPYYSQAIANWICSKNLEAYNVVEIGGGRGTNAKHLVDMLPSLKRYEIWEYSPVLMDLQRKIDSPKLQIKDLDVVDVAENRTISNGLLDSDVPTFVIALEVLDNLPHDQVKYMDRTLQQAMLVESEDKTLYYEELYQPVRDPLLKEAADCLHITNGWVPTIAFGLLRTILSNPNTSMLLADFDWLPGQPLVTDMSGRDHSHYLNVVESPTDILFATDFNGLAVYSNTFDRTTTVSKQADFLLEYLVDVPKGFLTGYSPMIDDYGNCSILTIDSKA